MKTRLVLASLLLLTACGIAGPRHAVTWYVLEDQGTTQKAATPRPDTLLLRETEAPGFYQSNALVFSRTPGTRGYYQYSRLTEMPAQRLTQLLRVRLDQAGLYAAVAPLGSGVDGAYQLNARLIDLYHDNLQPPGEVKLVLELQLVRRSDARQIAATRIATHAPAASADAQGAAAAANLATTRALDQAVAWLAGLPR